MRPIGLLCLTAAVLLAGCSRPKPPSPRQIDPGADDRRPDPVRPVADGNKGGTPAPGRPVVDPEKYEAALLEAVDHLAERDYPKALAALKEAQKFNDTGAVQREIDKVQALLTQQEEADRAVKNVRTVLEEGRPEEAARLARQALDEHGGGDRGADLGQLQRQAEAVVTEEVANNDARRERLRKDAVAAHEAKNLRAAAVALEQALALGDDADLAGRLAKVRQTLQVYDDNRRAAAEMRRDPTQLEAALTRLQAARKAWDTLQVRQEIDEFRLLLERRRDRIAVADFEVRGDVGAVAAGRQLAEELLPRFRPRFDIVERGQLARVLDELRLEAGELADGGIGGAQVNRLARVRYLVVGSVTANGGVTLNARLVEVATGLVAQTARVTAPTFDELRRKLPRVALLLTMSDEQRLAEERREQEAAAAVPPVEATPVVTYTPPPPVPAVPPPPVVTYTPRPVPMGALVIEDFRRLPPVVVVPAAPPPAFELVIARDDPRRHRLLRLSLDLGDNLFRRGHYREAQRHFSLALTLAGPRRELSLRVDECRRLAPPPPPAIVLPAPVAPRPVVVVPPPARPRMAVFAFVPSRPGLVPPAVSEVLADQLASYFGGQYETIDRGEVCWYMGRLNLTYHEVLTNPISRRCLAQALNARYFVFSTVVETASFNVSTHLIDAETGNRTGTGAIHVKDQQELKLRLSELARQMGAKPDEQQRLAKQGQAAEAALAAARNHLKANQPDRALEAARAGLKEAPNNVALQAVRAEAERKQRLAAFEQARFKEAADRAADAARAKKRQEELRQAAEKARLKAEADARLRGEAERKAQEAQRQKAADQLRAQAKQAAAKGDHARAAQLLQGAASLRPSDETFRELAQARADADKAARERAKSEQDRADKARQARLAAEARRVEQERAEKAKVEAARRQQEQARAKTLHDGFRDQAAKLLKEKKYPAALAAAQSARRYLPSDESAALMRQAQDGIALDAMAKQSADERRKAEVERKAREDRQKKDQADYLAAMTKGREAVAAKRYTEAVAQYTVAEKLFKTDAARTGLATARDLLRREQDARDADARRAQQVKALIAEGHKALAAKQYPTAIDKFTQANRLSPGNVEALAGLSRAERERDAAARPPVDAKGKKLEEDFKLYMDAARAAHAKKNYQGALNALGNALNLKPTDPGALALRADSERLLKAQRAEETYQAALRQGRAMLTAKKYADALRSFDEALKVKPGDAAAGQGKRDAEAGLKAPPPVDPKKKAYDAAMTAGRAHVKAKKYADAVRQFDEALKVYPTDKAARSEHADAARLLKDEQDRAARAKAEAAYNAWMKLGRDEMAKKKYAEAFRAFDEALKAKPGDAAGVRAKQDAKKALDDAVKPPVDPKGKKAEEDFKLYMDAARAAHAKKNYQGALNALGNALNLKPTDPGALALRADSERLLKAQRAEEAYQAAMKRGRDAMTAKKYADAMTAFNEAQKFKPKDPAAVAAAKEAADRFLPPPVNPQAEFARAMQQGAALEKQKKYGDAVKAYQAALKWVPTDARSQAQAYLGVGRAEHAARRFAEAVKAYEEVLKRNPADAEAKAALPRARANRP